MDAPQVTVMLGQIVIGPFILCWLQMNTCSFLSGRILLCNHCPYFLLLRLEDSEYEVYIHHLLPIQCEFFVDFWNPSMLGSSKNPTWVDLESDLSKLTPDEQVMIKRVLVKDAIVNNGETFSYRSGFALWILAWCPIQMRAFHSNESCLLFPPKIRGNRERMGARR